MERKVALSVFALLFLFANWTFASLYIQQEQYAYSRNSITASVWDSILNFFGLNSDNNQSYIGNEKRNSAVDAEDFFGTNSQAKQNSNYQSVDTTEILTNSGTLANFACLPPVKHKGEPVIFMYKCPNFSKLSDSSFATSGDSGVVIRSDLTGKQYLDCITRGTNRTQRFECDIQEIDPAILEFAIYPTNPLKGDAVNLIAKTKDMNSCLIYNEAGNLKKSGQNFDFNYISAANHDKITLYCEDLSGLKIKRVISY